MIRAGIFMLVVLLGQSVAPTLCWVACAVPGHHDASGICREAPPVSDSTRSLTASDSACDHTVAIIATVEKQQGIHVVTGPAATTSLHPGLTSAVEIAPLADRQIPAGRVHQAFPLRI